MKHIDTTLVDAQNLGEPEPEFVLDPEDGETRIARIVWHSTDGWRGYYETQPVDGWASVASGANCGNWEDTPPGTSNGEVEEKIDRLEAKHGDVIVVLLPTSNVFSMGYEVLVRGEQPEPSYKIVRHYASERPREEIDTGLTLDEAQAHCQREDTHGNGWFDGYEEAV